MKKLSLKDTVSRKINKIGFQLKKHSPEILIGAGVVGVVASGVMACKATTKLDAIMEQAKVNIDAIHNAVEHPELLPANSEYTPEDAKKDLTITYIQTGVKVAKLYAPSIALGTLSLAAIITSHRIMTKRNVALAAAYTVVDKSFKDYRSRVVDRFGEALDHELRYNIKAREIEETVVDEKGKEKKVKKTIDVVEGPVGNEYSRFFDDGCLGWTKDPELNLTFLVQQQNWANDRLKAKGYLFLNEVYEALGIPRSKAGQIVGWIYDEKCPNGDNFVDFGIFDTHRNATRDFVNGYERTILLDFNVDGPIIDLL